MAPVSTIRLTFEGMLLLFVNHDREYCDVGFLKGVPHHAPKLLITKIPRGGGAPAKVLEIPDPSVGRNFQDRLWLDVKKTGARVRLHKTSVPDPDFVRDPATDNEDFRWAVNLEGREVYDRELKAGIAFDRLNPMLRIYDGLFYAQTPLSANELSRQRFDESASTRLGKVAVQLRAEIGLDAGNLATLYNGDSDPTSLRAEQNVDYGIYVCNSRPPGHAGTEVDANNYHAVVGIGPSRRVHFSRYPEASASSTPDAVCLPGWMGSTVLP